MLHDSADKRWYQAGIAVAAFLALGVSSWAVAPAHSTGPRRVIRLDCTWAIGQGAMETVPQKFDHRVSVPGLVDMAEPTFAEVGQKSNRRQAFWYCRTFKIDSAIPPVALLKIGKAKYGTRVYVDGNLVGDHDPCF